MYGRVVGLLFFVGLFSVLFSFGIKNVNAQVCQGTLNCYIQSCSLKCSISGISCNPLTAPCGANQGSCANSCTYVPNGISDCGTLGQPVGTCQDAQIGCMDSNGNSQSKQCSNPVLPPTPTPAPGSTPTPSSCGGGSNPDCNIAPGGNCGQEGKVVGAGTCANGNLCCIDKSTSGSPTDQAQGAYAYCQDGNGLIYPLPGLPIRMSGTNQVGGAVTNYGDVTTDTFGRAMHVSLSTSPTQWFNLWIDIPPSDQITVHPLSNALYPYGALKVPGTGQLYSNLTLGDTHNSIFENCANSGGVWTAAGNNFPSNWYCGGNPNPLNPLTWAGQPYPTSYYVGIVGKGNYNAFLHFSSCGGPTPTPAPIPSCTISVSPSSFTMVSGDTRTITPTITQQNGVISSVTYTSSDIAVAAPASPQNISPFSTQITAGAKIATATITASGIMNGVPTCNTTFTITTAPTAAWWQVQGGAAISGNNGIQSTIPLECVLPACDPHFNLNGAGGTPGNTLYWTTTNLTSLSVSSKGWKGNTTYGGKMYDSAYFNNIAPTTINYNNAGGVVPSGRFNAGQVSSDGYTYFKANGDVTINTPVVIAGGEKVVLFVEGGNLNIESTINITSPGQDYFMAIVSGNINIDPIVTSASGPAIQGIYEADGIVDTGAGASPLLIQGTIVAWGGVNFKRDLQGNNFSNPAEKVVYDPALIISFPRSLIQDDFAWSEVLP